MSSQKINAESTRHFYAVKNDTPYVFPRIAERNSWLARNSDAIPTSAVEAYRLLRKQRNSVVAANRLNRVFLVDSVGDIDQDKGQRLILS